MKTHQDQNSEETKLQYHPKKMNINITFSLNMYGKPMFLLFSTGVDGNSPQNKALANAVEKDLIHFLAEKYSNYEEEND